FGLGAVAGFIDTARHDQPMVNGSLGATEVTGTIIDRADREGRVRVVLTDLGIERLSPEETPQRIRISVRGGEGLRPGQRIRLRAVLNGPSGPVMPGGFDFRRYAYFHGWGAVGYSVSTPDVIEDRPAGAGSPALEQTRFSIRERIRAVLPGQDGAVATALLTGERGDLSTETVEALRIAGLAHLLAISGLHVGLVAGLIFVSSRALMATSLRLALAWPIKKIAAVAALIGCFAYVALVGAPVPTQRAFIMAFVVLVAVMLDREAISLRTVAIAALVVLALSPNAVLGASFQLSFAAVIALVAVYEWLTENKAPTETDRSLIGRLSRYFGAVMLTTIVAGLATLPFGLFHFSRFAPWSIAANLIGVPLTAFFIMPFGVISLLLMPLELEQISLPIMGWGIDKLIELCTVIAAWPSADIRVPAMPSFGLALAALGGLWVCLLRGPVRYFGIPLIILALFSYRLVPTPAILIAEDQSLIGIIQPGEQSVALSKTRSESFVRSVWLSRLGYRRYNGWPEPGNPTALGRCDDLGCQFDIEGRQITIANRPGAMAEECGRATLIIASGSGLPGCEWDLVIDEKVLADRGAIAVYLGDEKGRWRIIGARDGQKNRPWSQRP
ncbi:MAG: ComEC/Rec2 family competence protein, partial [Pseudomonadota bacterium]